MNWQDDNKPPDGSGTMTRISQSPFFFKRVFPVLWFGFLGVFVVVGGGAAIAQGGIQESVPLLFVPLVMAIFGYVMLKLFVFGLVDEVWDCGDALLVRNNGIERRFKLGEFMSVGYTGMVNPPRITLSLREPSEFGSEIKFIPPFRWFPYSTPPIARDLMLRIDAARRGA